MNELLKLLIKIFILTIFLNQISFANLEKVSLQIAWKHQFEFAGFYAAIEKGYYKDVGLALEIKELKDGVNVSEDVINQKSTFGTTSSSLILERLKNKPVVLIASYFKQNSLALATKENIKTPHDLKNKKIMAVNSEIEQSSLGAMLKDSGINKEDYTLIKHDYNINKFVNNEVDAMHICYITTL